MLTVIKILQLEQVHETSHGHMDWKSSRKSVLKHGSGERETTVKGRQPLETSNRYSALQIVESDDDIGVRPCFHEPGATSCPGLSTVPGQNLFAFTQARDNFSPGQFYPGTFRAGIQNF